MTLCTAKSEERECFLIVIERICGLSNQKNEGLSLFSSREFCFKTSPGAKKVCKKKFHQPNFRLIFLSEKSTVLVFTKGTSPLFCRSKKLDKVFLSQRLLQLRWTISFL